MASRLLCRSRMFVRLAVALSLAAAVAIPATAAETDGAPRVRLRDGRLSVEATAGPWPALLAALARDARVRVHADAPPDALTVAFADLPLERALARLFGHSTGFVIRYPASPAGETEVWVLGAIERPVRPATANADQATFAELMRVMRDEPDPDARSAAAAALAARVDDEAIAELGLALSDPDASVRIRAIEALAERGGDAALAVLRTALDDRDRAVSSTARAALPGMAGTVR